MHKNIGEKDKLIRFILSVVLIFLGHFYKTEWLSALGTLILITGYFSWCGLYSLLDINTCPTCYHSEKEPSKDNKADNE